MEAEDGKMFQIIAYTVVVCHIHSYTQVLTA